jgi:cardiolipin synthase
VWATIGTTNFDSRSFAHNDETNVCFYEPALVQKMEQSFMADLAVSEKVSLDQWERRGILTKAQDIISALLQDQV